MLLKKMDMMNNSPQVSIIVPVYNTEKYLRKCIDSIIAQINKDWELLLVDDGSKDGSGKICDEYAAKDSRIRVFHKENGGVSSARNLALDNARGEWLAFVDSDDIVDENYLSLEEVPQNTDVIVKSFQRFDDSGSVISKHIIDENSLLNKGEELNRRYVLKRQNSLWNKIINMRIIGNCRFDTSVKVGEDFLFFLACFHKIQSVFYSSIGSYFYIVHEGSAMSKADRDLKRRVEILLANINNIKRLTEGKTTELIGKNIIALSYLSNLYRLRGVCDKNIAKRIIERTESLKLTDMKYLSLRQKIKFLLQRLYFSVKA